MDKNVKPIKTCWEGDYGVQQHAICKMEKAMEKLNKNKGVKNDFMFEGLNERTRKLDEHFKKNKESLQKTLLEKEEDKKKGIERQLESSEKRLSELLAYGNELVTNIKVAAEKRELDRRYNEASMNKELTNFLQKETAEYTAKYNTIAPKWLELKQLKEPMILNEEFNIQKAQIAELMQKKNNIIQQCQEEINRINKKYHADQEKQASDVCCLVERIDSQIELLKFAYKSHLNLLENIIEDERRTVSLNNSNKLSAIVREMSTNEAMKYEVINEKEAFYAIEIERIGAKQAEITRSTRIRLEKDAEMLEWELRNMKNTVLMNSEKLDYNYQVLQKRNEENVIINNQQKRRVAKLNEFISTLKKKIQSITLNTENVMQKLAADIQKLHSSISELEKKSLQFRQTNRMKFDKVWEINMKETKSHIAKVMEIDKILQEQQLSFSWTETKIDLENINMDAALSLTPPPAKQKYSSEEEKKETIKSTENLFEVNMLRKILRKIASRAGFLVEGKLVSILEQYEEDEKCLVRIDNILNALRIQDFQSASSLIENFKPFTWCVNCATEVSANCLKSLYGIENVPIEAATQNVSETCENHVLVIEPALVLESLRNFTYQRSAMKRNKTQNSSQLSIRKYTVELENETIRLYWENFATFMSKEKKKLWAAVEHGLNHFQDVLKKRERLHYECKYLKQQNIEFEHLLQKFYT